jgi:hypothetical protein
VRITREWLAATDHCADGLAFGRAEIPAEGMELADCWPRIHRADWALSLAVKTETIDFELARRLVERLLRAAAHEAGDQDTIAALDVLAVTQDLAGVRASIANLAYTATAVKGDVKTTHRLNAAGLLAAADGLRARAGADADLQELALRDLQGAAYGLGLVVGQDRAAELVKAEILGLAAVRADVR